MLVVATKDHSKRFANEYWCLWCKENGASKVITGSHALVEQESYTEDGLPEDLMWVFTSLKAVNIFLKVFKKVLQGNDFDAIRIHKMNREQMLTLITKVDACYQNIVDRGFRVEICSARGNELERELLYSRQVPKH